MAIEKMVLTSDDVCSIIKVCGEAKVSELRFGGLHVKFSGSEPRSGFEPVREATEPQLQAIPSLSNPDAATSGQMHEKINEDSLVNEETLSREEELAMALIEDPVLAEKLIIAGKLEEETNVPDELDS